MAYGFAGPVYPVHPEARHVGGVRAYPSVLDVPDEVDLAVVAVPAAAVAEVVEQCGRKGVHGLVVCSGGFGERDDEPVASWSGPWSPPPARNGMRVVGPNCLGVVNADPAVRLNATIAPLAPRPGRVGFFCQSGALGVAILAAAARWGLGLSTFVSAGNRADVSGNDLLQYWERDPATDVVLLYLESFGNPRKFARLARRVARTKPVVAVKTRPVRGRRRPALAARAVPVPEERVQALFEKAGRDPGRHADRAVRRRAAAGVPAAADGIAGGDGRQLDGARRAGRRRVPGAPGWTRAALVDVGPDAGRAGVLGRRAARRSSGPTRWSRCSRRRWRRRGTTYARALAEVAARRPGCRC